jgi:hypothetical protein
MQPSRSTNTSAHAAQRRVVDEAPPPPFAPKSISCIPGAQDGGISKQSTPNDIQNALYSEFGLSASDVAKFC